MDNQRQLRGSRLPSYMVFDPNNPIPQLGQFIEEERKSLTKYQSSPNFNRTAYEWRSYKIQYLEALHQYFHGMRYLPLWYHLERLFPGMVQNHDGIRIILPFREEGSNYTYFDLRDHGYSA